MQDKSFLKKNDKPYFIKYDKTNPDISDYIKNRFEPQINWYNNKATDNMYRYNALQILTLVTSSLISIVNVISDLNTIIRILSAVLGGAIAAGTGIMQLTKSQETWILYRTTAETLMKEYNLYMLKAGNYSQPSLTDDKRNELFIERCESLMSSEGMKYFSLHQQKNDSKTN
jgi:hypothetical protein